MNEMNLYSADSKIPFAKEEKKCKEMKENKIQMVQYNVLLLLTFEDERKKI